MLNRNKEDRGHFTGKDCLELTGMDIEKMLILAEPID